MSDSKVTISHFELMDPDLHNPKYGPEHRVPIENVNPGDLFCGLDGDKKILKVSVREGGRQFRYEILFKSVSGNYWITQVFFSGRTLKIRKPIS